MRFFSVCFFLLVSTLMFSCEEKEKIDPCYEMVKQLEGTYLITITSYPKQSGQEGDQKDVLVFFKARNCYNKADTNEIQFNSLFDNFECTGPIKFIDNKFKIEYQNNQEWYGAPIKGEGSIINGVFHFSGTINTSTGEYPIILDGNKTSSDRRTDAC